MPSREPELYKDKIEVSLDGRQIFYLFFGGAAIVGLVFVLGVLVGRRVEARGHLDHAETQAETDPLAALDRLERSDRLSFHGALRGSEAPTDVEKAIGELEKKRAAQPDKKPEPDKPARPEKGDEPVSRPETDKPRPEADKPRPEKKADSTATSEKKPRKHDEPATDSRSEPRPAKAEARRPEGGDREARPERPDTDAKPTSEAKVRFTLQLSSFQARSEAEAFLSATKSAGYQPYLVEADVSGKGTFYRVRLGSYRSLEAANDAKAEYEKAAKKTAQVMRL
jgi:DedD protein